MEITPAPQFDEAADPARPASAPVLASWTDRVEAAVIDLFVRLAIIAVPVGVGALLFVAGEDAGYLGLAFGLIIGLFLATFLYAPLMMAHTDGQTIGHRSAGTRVVMADGSRMSFGTAFVREVLVKGILMEWIGGFTFYILTLVNYLFPLWDPNNEALHDKMVHTRVVRT